MESVKLLSSWLERAVLGYMASNGQVPTHGGYLDATDSGVRPPDLVPQTEGAPAPPFRFTGLPRVAARAPGPAMQGLLALLTYLADRKSVV